MATIGDIMVTHTQQIIVKKKRISFEKVKLADANIKYKTKLKDKGVKYYTKFKCKDKEGKDKDRMLISVKLKYKDYKNDDKEDTVIIVTRYDLKDETEIDAFIDENILEFERQARDDRACDLRDECVEHPDGFMCDCIITSEEYDVVM